MVFFFLSFSICYLYLLPPLSHIHYFLHSQLYFCFEQTLSLLFSYSFHLPYFKFYQIFSAELFFLVLKSFNVIFLFGFFPICYSLSVASTFPHSLFPTFTVIFSVLNKHYHLCSRILSFNMIQILLKYLGKSMFFVLFSKASL